MTVPEDRLAGGQPEWRARIKIITVIMLVASWCAACVTYPAHDATPQQPAHQTSQTAKEVARIYLDMGLMRLAQQNQAEAEYYLLRAQQSEPDNVTAIESLALLYQLQSKYQQAEHWFSKGLQINPHHGRLHYNYGILLYQLRRYQTAKKAFLAALRDPAYAEKHRASIQKNIMQCAQWLQPDKRAAE